MPMYFPKTSGCDDDLLVYSPSLLPKPILLDGTVHGYDDFSNVMTIEEFNQYVSIRIIDEIEHNTFLLEDGTVIKPSKKTPGIKLLSECLKTTYTILYRLRRKGHSWKNIIQHYQTLTTPVFQNKHTKSIAPKIDHKGVEYDSFSQMCQSYGISPGVVRARLLHGNDLETALTRPLRTKSMLYETTYKGQSYRSIDEILTTHNINRSLYNKRVKQYPEQTLEEIIDGILKDRNN